ncbi:MAG: carbohydrate kinase family protein [Promethearchaeota archaeon]|nr:MAG: carbohydrate kinase family protein [Candidatus Lokiarchaeota archaeon]
MNRQNPSNLEVDFIICGDINIDIITKPIEKIQKEISIVQKEFKVFPGGNANNTALTLNNLGTQVHFIGALGGSNDPISDWLIKNLKENRISHTISRKKIQSGITFAISYDDGSRTFIATLGSNELLDINDIDFTGYSAKHFHRAGYWWAPKLQGNITDRIFQMAKNKNMTTSLGLSWDPNNWENRLELLKNLKFCDIILLNEKELKALTDTENLDNAIDKLRDYYSGIIGIHRGDNGSIIVKNSDIIKITSKKIKVVNSTGSGDVYDAGFIYGYIYKKWDIEKAGRFANACAEVHIQNLDMKYPTLQEVENYLKISR